VVELGEHQAFQLQVLEDRFDDEIGARRRFGEIGRRTHAGQSPFSFRLAELPLLDTTHQVTVVRLERFLELLSALILQPHIDPVQRCLLGDLRSHAARPYDCQSHY
jgi:hypothetical protein